MLRRTRGGAPSDGEAQELILAFEAKHQWIPLVQLAEERRAGSLVASHSLQDGKSMWEIRSRVWTNRAIVFTYVHEGGSSELLQDALGIFEGTRPVS